MYPIDMQTPMFSIYQLVTSMLHLTKFLFVPFIRRYLNQLHLNESKEYRASTFITLMTRWHKLMVTGSCYIKSGVKLWWLMY